MSPEEVITLDELLSLESSPAGSLTAEQRADITRIFEAAPDEEALEALGKQATAALDRHGENLRALYAMSLFRELAGESEDAGVGYHNLARALEKQRDWEGVRDMALRALPLRPDYRVVRLLLAAWENMEAQDGVEEELALAASLCPDSPDLLWLQACRADAEGRAEEAEERASAALGEYVRRSEADRAEEPLLRVLDSENPRVCRTLIGTLPRMATRGLEDLMQSTLELAEERIAGLNLHGDLARTLERILLRDDPPQWLRGRYATALAASLGGGESVEAFVADCGLGDLETPIEEALERFREMYSLRPGAFVEHAGFGVGRIASHDGDFLVLDFAGKPGHRMALEIARRSLRPLPENCLRVARFSDPEGIAREVSEDPVALLVRALTDLGGTATARDLRECLAGNTVAEGDWTGWWKRAREAAQEDLRVNTTQSFRQTYRLPSEAGDDELELPPLPSGGVQGAVTLIERLLKQHPELDERAKDLYAAPLADRARQQGRQGEGVAAVPLLMRWLPGDAEEWRKLAEAAFRREPGVAGGITAHQQRELLELGLGGDAWDEAAFSALASRFPAVRKHALEALRSRLGDQFPAVLRDRLMARDGRVLTRLAVVGLGLSGALEQEALDPWELLTGALIVIGSNPPPKVRDAALDLMDPQEDLATLLAHAELPEALADEFNRAARDAAASEVGIEPMCMLLSGAGRAEQAEELRNSLTREVTDAIAIHFDPKVTLMSRATYEGNQERIRDLQRQLATEIPQEIGAARALGDLSENAAYHAARERQGLADASVRSLQSQMENARVIEALHFPEGTAAVGTEVVVRDLEHGQEQTLWILGHGDSVQDAGVINYRAPLGQALVGKSAGDTLELDTDGGTRRMEVLRVSKRLS